MLQSVVILCLWVIVRGGWSVWCVLVRVVGQEALRVPGCDTVCVSWTERFAIVELCVCVTRGVDVGRFGGSVVIVCPLCL